MTETASHVYVWRGRWWDLRDSRVQQGPKSDGSGMMGLQQNGPETGVSAPVDPGASLPIRRQLVTSSYPCQDPLSVGSDHVS